MLKIGQDSIPKYLKASNCSTTWPFSPAPNFGFSTRMGVVLQDVAVHASTISMTLSSCALSAHCFSIICAFTAHLCAWKVNVPCKTVGRVGHYVIESETLHKDSLHIKLCWTNGSCTWLSYSFLWSQKRLCTTFLHKSSTPQDLLTLEYVKLV